MHSFIDHQEVNMDHISDQYLLRQGDGAPIAGTAFRYKLRAEDTGGRLTLLEAIMQPGELIPPHTHTLEDEFTFVYKGSIGVRAGENDFTMPTGSIIFKPRGILHSMWNPTPEPAILFETITPAGFEGFFEEMGQLTITNKHEGPAQVDAIAAKYGAKFHWELMPEIMAKVNHRPGS
jgi:quercetin dioxygenase-like cupin family protein